MLFDYNKCKDTKEDFINSFNKELQKFDKWKDILGNLQEFKNKNKFECK